MTTGDKDRSFGSGYGNEYGYGQMSRDFCREIKSTVVYLCSIRVCRGGRDSGKCGRIGEVVVAEKVAM